MTEESGTFNYSSFMNTFMFIDKRKELSLPSRVSSRIADAHLPTPSDERCMMTLAAHACDSAAVVATACGRRGTATWTRRGQWTLVSGQWSVDRAHGVIA